MTTNSARPIPSETSAGRRLAAWPLLAVLAGAGMVGCSSSDGSAAEFVGTWTVDPDTSNFTLSCPFLEDGPLAFPLWSVVRMEEGTLSDLVELGGPCPGYYDINKKVASMVSPDPFTGAAPFCRVDESTDEAVSYLEFQFTGWNINLLKPVKGEAPKAQVIGNAKAPLFIVDPAGVPQLAEGGDCTYVVKADLTKIGKN